MFNRKRYRVGDVLMLKSGSAPMTAIYVGPVVFAEGVWVTCQWSDKRGQLQQETFPEFALTRVADTLAATPGRSPALRRIASAVRRMLSLRFQPGAPRS